MDPDRLKKVVLARCGYTTHLPMCIWLMPTGREIFVGDIWTRQPKELPIAVAEVICMVTKNPKRLNQSQESEM